MVREHPFFAETVEDVLLNIDEKPLEETLTVIIDKKFYSHLDWLGFTKEQWIEEIIDEINGYGPIKTLIQSDKITEICINSYNNIFFSTNGEMQKYNQSFSCPQVYLRFVTRILNKIGKAADIRNPLVDGTILENKILLRVHFCLPPITQSPAVTIRKHCFSNWTLEELMLQGMFSKKTLETLLQWIHSKKNILICGPTDSGKTTLMRSLLNNIPNTERILSLEDTHELGQIGNHHIPMLTRESDEELIPSIDLNDLLRNALRMRPDRIVVGEIRGKEALLFLDALSTGHRGAICTIHSGSALQSLKRIESLALRGLPQLNLISVRQTVAESVEGIIVCKKIKGQRQITELALLKGSEDFGYLLEPLPLDVTF